MRGNILLIAYFLVCANCLAQQYPFVHYTPKDGLVSNRVRSIYQDSKGRIYFVTLNGLSVYDGARFTNYTSEDGLHSDIVNCVMEMGDDSLWVATNTGSINCLVKGKIKTLALKNPLTPLVNYLCRDDRGNLYAAADDGLFAFQQNTFVKLPFSDQSGEDINRYIATLIPVGDYLLCLRDPGLGGIYILYLYDCRQKRIVSQTTDIKVISMAKAGDGRLWVSTNKGIRAINLPELLNGKIMFEELPLAFKSFSEKSGSIFFDATDNCWISGGTYSVIKCDESGNTTEYTTSSGLSTVYIGYIFQDKEGITWLASNGGGVDKLMHTNFSVMEKPFGLLSPSSIFLSNSKEDVLIFSAGEEKVVRVYGNGNTDLSRLTAPVFIGQFLETSRGTYGIGIKKVFTFQKKGSTWLPEMIFSDTSEGFGHARIDNNGNLLISCNTSLTAILEKSSFQVPVNYLSDQLAVDTEGNVWAANRADQLIVYSTHPENPSAYLQQKHMFTDELKGLSPRAITIDKNDNIWIGTRYKGLFVFQKQNEKLHLLFNLTSKTGLSENFVSYLICDDDNMVWACTPSGLDKISMQNNKPVVENLTRQNNIYQNIYKVVVDKNKTAWAITSGAIIKITTEKKPASGYIPRLLLTRVFTGPDSLQNENAAVFSYKQNNISFYFAAPSFLDEKQILYSYQLLGSSNNQWSNPSDNASVSFIELKPGSYTLNIKAIFPAGRYPDQTLSYSFSITPPWWQTWWFRTGIALVGIVLLVSSIRFYYRRKMEKQKVMLEKQQAVQKERTRIATDMHDDLGAGLSRIKFLSETIGLKKQQQQPIEEDITKIREYSHEMIDKMGEIVWALNEKNDSLSDLLAYTRSYAVEYLSQNGVRCSVSIPENIPDLFVTGEFRRNVYLTVKEALHNIVKHAQAESVMISVMSDHYLHISIKDNGAGFDKKNIRPFSNGISNMEKRITEINGTFKLSSEPGGTEVKFVVPLG